MDVVEAVTEVVGRHPAVTSVELVGSRARGTPTALSDWDFRIEGTDLDRLFRDLPETVGPLQPLAAQWDRLSERAVFMLILPAAVKVDLFPGDRPHQVEPQWGPGSANLAEIDAHFWDWIVWLARKALGDQALVAPELEKLHRNLLAPLGASTPPPDVGEAVERFVELRHIAEERYDIVVDRRLGDEVVARLRSEGLV